MSRVSAGSLNRAFEALEFCARNGDRCPITSGPGSNSLLKANISALAKAGRISIEISGTNWRRVTILTGPHKGKSTAANPHVIARVWQTIGREGAKIIASAGRAVPSAPRVLTAAELSR
jgi:hypothetical protein